MAFSPKDKKSDSKSKKPPGQEQPQAGPPQPGLPPMPQQPPLPGAPIDPFAAMQGQASAGPMPMDPMAMGGGMPGGMPPMGMPPMPGADGDIDDAMLMAMLSGQGWQDPYSTFPGEPDMGFGGMGVGPPQMGLEEMIKLLMLAQAGVNPGTPVNSSSGLMSDPASNVMAGFSPPDGNVGFGMY